MPFGSTPVETAGSGGIKGRLCDEARTGTKSSATDVNTQINMDLYIFFIFISVRFAKIRQNFPIFASCILYSN
jgi:hypothetical protein